MGLVDDSKKNSRALAREKAKKPEVIMSMKLIRLTLAFIVNECCLENKGFIKKIYQLFSRIDDKIFMNNHSLEMCYRAILSFSKVITLECIYDIELVAEKVAMSDINYDNMCDDLENCSRISLDSSMRDFVFREITERLNFIEAIPHIKKMRNLIDKFDSNTYETFARNIDAVKEASIQMQRSMHNKNVSSSRLSLPEVDFNDKNFSDLLGGVVKNLNNPKRYVRTGIKRLNEALGGGFQPGRVYVFIGLSGGFKSGIILNTALWGPRFNKGMVCNDPKRKPMFIYLTQENDSEETLDRMFSYMRCIDADGKVKHVESIHEEMVKNDFISDDHAFRIIYRRKYEIDANDIEAIVRDIESEGVYEVKFIAHDYLKRLRPISPSGDTRVDLGEATNDLSELAKLLKIPIVTGNQLNRKAYETLLQEGKNANKNDLGRNASLDMQSESQLITENADVVIAINREVKEDEWFLAFNRLKDRSSKRNEKMSNRYFAVPFEKGNSMRLMEDEGTEYKFDYDTIAVRRVEETNSYGYNKDEMDDFEKVRKMTPAERVASGLGHIILPGETRTARELYIEGGDGGVVTSKRLAAEKKRREKVEEEEPLPEIIIDDDEEIVVPKSKPKSSLKKISEAKRNTEQKQPAPVPVKKKIKSPSVEDEDDIMRYFE